MNARDRHKEDVDLLDRVLGALSHRSRRQIVMVLHHMGGEMTAGQIASRFSCSWPTVTRHLGVLKKAGLVEVAREGTNVKYRLKKEPIRHIWKCWFEWLELGL